MTANSKSQYHHGSLRAAVLGRAPEWISEVGLENFSLRGLARDLGVTHGAVYKHFSDKRDVFVALSLEGHAEFSQALTKAIRAEKGIETAVKDAARAYVRWALEHSSVYQVMFGARLNEDAQYEDLEKAIQTTFLVVDEAFSSGGFSPPRKRELTVALMTQLHGYCDLIRLQRIRVKDATATQRYLTRILSPFIAGVCAEADAK
ncbi:MAG: TetR/AcrR family transcriptional regulator [Parvibaculaceae bacterium]|nr:TetR/AcrR family transcriptional regulator [Parvibaculaceae bacterium]